jgi:hypothetical protein
MIWIQHHLQAAYLALPTLDMHADDPDFSMGDQTGKVMVDHSSMAIASSNRDIGILAADFKAFDASQRWANIRRHLLAGIVNGLIKHGISNHKFGEWELEEYFVDMWSEGKVYKVKFVSKQDGVEKVIELDQLLSGEFMTIAINNMSNRANYLRFLNEVLAAEPEISEQFRFLFFHIMGDDSIAFANLGGGWNAKLYDSYVSKFVQSSAESGFELNYTKTVFRRYYGEYLKIRFIYGYFIPLQHIQAIDSERLPSNLNPPDMIGSYASTIASADLA